MTPRVPVSCDAGDGGSSLLFFGCTVDAIVGGDVAGDMRVLLGPSVGCVRRKDIKEKMCNVES